MATIKQYLTNRAAALDSTIAELNACKEILKNLVPELSVAQNKSLSDVLFALGLTDHPTGGLRQWIDDQLNKLGNRVSSVRSLIATLPDFSTDQEAEFFKVLTLILTRGLK